MTEKTKDMPSLVNELYTNVEELITALSSLNFNDQGNIEGTNELQTRFTEFNETYNEWEDTALAENAIGAKMLIHDISGFVLTLKITISLLVRIEASNATEVITKVLEGVANNSDAIDLANPEKLAIIKQKVLAGVVYILECLMLYKLDRTELPLPSVITTKLINEVNEILHFIYPGAKIIVDKELEGFLGQTNVIINDLSRIVINLVSNALRAAGRKDLLADIQVHYVIKEDCLYILVEDKSGGGLEPKHFQLGITEHAESGGQGLGLANVVNLASFNQLTLGVKSKEVFYNIIGEQDLANIADPLYDTSIALRLPLQTVLSTIEI